MKLTTWLAAVTAIAMVGACADSAPPPMEVPGMHVVTFAPVADGTTYLQSVFGTAPGDAAYELAMPRRAIEELAARLPAGETLAFGERDGDRERVYVLDPVALGGADVARVQITHDAATDRPELAVELSDARHAHDVTAALVGRRLAVLVDGTVLAAPRLASPLDDGRARITFDAAVTDAQLAALR